MQNGSWATSVAPFAALLIASCLFGCDGSMSGEVMSPDFPQDDAEAGGDSGPGTDGGTPDADDPDAGMFVPDASPPMDAQSGADSGLDVADSTPPVDAAPLPTEQLFPVAGDNLLPDPSLEGDSAWTPGGPTHVFASDPVRSGARSLAITSTGGATVTTFSDFVPLSPGQEYAAKAYVAAQNLVAGPNGAGDTPILLVNQRRDGERVPNGHGAQTDGYRWAPYDSRTYPFTDLGMTMQFQLVRGANQARIAARTWTHNSSGRTFWDDFEIVPLTFPHRGAELLVLQAEDATLTGGVVATTEVDYTGTGYVDVNDRAGATLVFDELATDGNVVVSVRYCREGPRTPMTFLINGEAVMRNVAPTPTGRRGIYATVDIGMYVSRGDVLTLEVGLFGGLNAQPMVDKVTVYRRLP